MMNLQECFHRLVEAGDSANVAEIREQCELILRSTRLVAFGSKCLLREIEFYHHSPGHPDPFTHCHDIQSLFGRWYAHRVGKGYKGGSFKGIDFTFGRDGSFGGMLIRSIETPEGDVICGPSLCVDRLIQLGRFENVASLDGAIADRPLWDANNPMQLVAAVPSEDHVYASARVGLNGFTVSPDRRPWKYLLRRYRFVTRPDSIKKGRVHLILAMARNGHSVEEIRGTTGSTNSAIQRHIQTFEQSGELSLSEIANLPAAKQMCALEKLDAIQRSEFH